MLTLEDGPAEGSYGVTRAPLFLRAVVDRTTGKKDVLDQVDDRPGDSEDIFIYERVGEVGTVHLNRGSRGSGFYAVARYRQLDIPHTAALRDNAQWQAWAESAGRSSS